MFQKIIRVLGGDPQKREIERLSEKVEQINALEKSFEALSDDALYAKTEELRTRYREMLESGIKKQEALDELLPDAFAAVREASKRTIGLRHYDVQLIGGAVLHEGKIAEMRTGEGKTLVATLPLYLNAISGDGVHLVTVNDYLARRDARWMAPIYMALGMSVGVLQMAARTDNGKMAFLVDPTRTSPHEDQHQLRLVPRKEAYAADITYGTNSEFGFDYLRDNLTMSLEERVQRGHYYAIVDEVDNILIDEARTPLIISGPAADESEWYIRMAQIIRQLKPEDYEIMEKERSVALTELGEAHVEELLGMQLRDPERPEDITPEQARILGYLEQALRAQFLYKRNKDYLVQAGKVVIVDEFTGRLMPGRRWSEGLHQAIEAKENVKVEPENVTYATITLQNYYRMYQKLAGMTGTAATEAEEFHKIYKLDVVTIPTNLEFIASKPNAELVAIDDKDEQGYRYTYYARRDDPEQKPVFWKRKDYTDVVYRGEEAKLRAITQEILRYHVMGRPQLVGTTSVEHSERLSQRLSAEPIRRLAQVLLIRQAWLEKSGQELLERPVPELQPLNAPLPELDTGTLRPVARSLGISLNPEDEENLERLLRILNLSRGDKPRLLKALQGGIPHQVLNAKKHDEESMIIAKAGAFGAVTIATNMAGRGVDIKLGGELPEELLNDINRVIARAGYDPYDMRNEERLQILQGIPKEEYGIYEESVNRFLQYVDEMKRVRELGGLHVIGSERHEARRIDNQLRGRAARQGDPGSSRFYLSLEDDLMRLFGGPQVEALWKRVFFDDSLPLEMNLLGRLVEQSQERVEGYNFDVRKHLLEYDDVLNAQRKRIYEQRDRAFTKEDLTEDILDMLRTDLQRRIPEALKDKEGPWKLLAYLNEIQPPILYEAFDHPSFPLAMMQEEVLQILNREGKSPKNLSQALLDLAQQALLSEKEHLLQSIENLLEKTVDALEMQIRERAETLDTFVESVGEQDENIPSLRPQDMLMQLSEELRIPLRLNMEQMRLLMQGDQSTRDALNSQIETHLKAIHFRRLIAAIERRLEESLDIKPAQLATLDIDELSKHILTIVDTVFERRMERLLGEQGQITSELNSAIARTSGDMYTPSQINQWLILMTYGTRMAFDQRTHRKVMQRVMRLNYIYLAAKWLSQCSAEEVTERVLQHLETGLKVLQQARGAFEWNRLAQTETTLSQLDQHLQAHIKVEIGEDTYGHIATLPLTDITNQEIRAQIQKTLGWWQQNQVHRELFLRIISDQWVDYLTRVEALRVSIGMEAYAQRDPLVQYKSQATDMFKNLLNDIRTGIVSRLFTYQTMRASSILRESGEGQTAVPSPAADAVAASSPSSQTQSASAPKKKRKRH